MSTSQKVLKRYKFINIGCREDELFENKPVYRVMNTKTKEQIAILSYYLPWKRYVFSTKEHIVFDQKCLEDLLDFLKTLK